MWGQSEKAGISNNIVVRWGVHKCFRVLWESDEEFPIFTFLSLLLFLTFFFCLPISCGDLQ
jgi:hypothetical protein